ncbi:DUF1028 domain-containing protein [Embleya sp. AB8]|uniref:DUF1028 domain-containing protein n=1 Tax=Embleya sp. AB8 TaxID=3156304 RepID=UPI003C76E38C
MTYSIVARDDRTGDLGVAAQSHFFSVGPLATWVRAGVGAVATQAFVDPGYGPRGLDLLAAGHPPESALTRLTEADDGRAQRQVALVDASGRTAVHTGTACYAHAEHARGPGVCAQGNMLTDPTIPAAMVDAYLATDGDLATRLLAGLDAAQRLGGDARGRQSAALKVIAGPDRPAGDGVLVDLRVDDAADPLAELRRHLHLQRAYHRIGVIFTPGMVTGDRTPDDNEVRAALTALEQAADLLPDSAEPLMWTAIILNRAGRTAEAATATARALAANPELAAFLTRLHDQGILPLTPADTP